MGKGDDGLGGAGWDPAAGDDPVAPPRKSTGSRKTAKPAARKRTPATRSRPANDPPAEAAAPEPLTRVAGTVRGFQTRTQSLGSVPQQIWTFRVDRYDDHGNVVQRVPVQMTGIMFIGAINEGDEVEIERPWTPGTTLMATEVKNLTTGAPVSTSKSFFTKKMKKVLLGIVGGFVGLILLIVLISALIPDPPTMPDLRGMPQAQAEEALRQLDVEWVVRTEDDLLREPGTVLRTDPPPGFAIEQPVVTLVIATEFVPPEGFPTGFPPPGG